jgi:nucleoside-diphosphate-sugar epimerase
MPRFALHEVWNRFVFHLRVYTRLEVLARVAADVVMVNGCYLVALVARSLYALVESPELHASGQVRRAFFIFAGSAPVLTIISLSTYALSGFYTRTRFYQGKYKLLAIVQAVTANYLIFGAVLYAGQAFDLVAEPPRLALALGWILTTLVTAGARLWSDLWRQMLEREAPRARSTQRAISGTARVQNVLVIGGAGYIGSVLCRELLHRGYSVRVLDPLLYGGESLEALHGHPHFELLEGDSRDPVAVCRSILGADAVIHLGEIVGDPACSIDDALTLQVNVAASRMVAEIAKGYGVQRFIYASSCSVYGASDEVLDERSTLNPVSLYGRAKIASEQALLGLNGSDFHPVILRLATVFGLSPRPRFDLVVNLLAAKAALERKIPIFGGNQWRPFVHVADVATAIVKCLEAPLFNVKAQIFNVGSEDQNFRILEVGQLVQEVVPEAILEVNGEDTDLRNYRVSFQKIRRELGFCCRYTVKDGIHEIVDAIRRGSISDPFHRKYSNYKTLNDPSNHVPLRWQPVGPLLSQRLA